MSLDTMPPVVLTGKGADLQGRGNIVGHSGEEITVRGRPDPAAQLRARARAHRRRFARKLGVSLRDFDAITAELLARWALARARLEADGTADGSDSERWWRGFNAEARALRRLEERVRELRLDANTNGRSALDAHLRENYGDGRKP